MMMSALLLIAVAGSGQEARAAEARSEAQARTETPARERRICRLQERLGTILPRRVCRSASDWALIDAAQEEITERDTAHMRNNARNSLYGPK
jgi:predicted secreted protein